MGKDLCVQSTSSMSPSSLSYSVQKPRSPESNFLAEGTAAVHGLRRALAELLASVDADPSEPQEVSRRFKLDKTLTWRISRMIREEDAWEAVGHIPGRPSIRSLVQKLESSGAPAQNAEAVRQAMESFERFVARHSGDRETFEIMVGAGDRPSASKRMEMFRKQGFLANSAAWGIQARLQIGFTIMAPSAEPGMIDMASINGLVDLRRLRANIPWAVANAHAWEDAATEIDARPEPLDGGGVNGVPLIPEFCTQPLPSTRIKSSPLGSKRFEIIDGGLGYTGATTVVIGWKWARTASIYGSRPDDTGEHGVHLWTPVEHMIHDLVVHKSLGFAMNPTASIYSDLPGGPRYPFEGSDVGRMNMPDEVVSLGASPPSMTTVEYPRYRELVDYAFARTGWNPNDFHAFRHRVRYPTIPTIALLRHPLLPPIAVEGGSAA